MVYSSWFWLVWLTLSGLSTSSLVRMAGGGGLRGSRGQTRGGDQHYQFLGIPFATPPTGDRRWRPPVPVSAWEGIREASVSAPHCLQMPLRTPTKITGSEDCLYLNVFTKSLDSAAKKPVLVFIPGGAFIA